MAIQMRRYELVPELQEHFLEWFQAIPAGRAKYGMKVLAAFVDRAGHEFTWIVEFDGDDAAFKAAEEAWMTSAERGDLFAGQPKHTVQIHVSMVDKII
jgi:antibiotic biosynthesis monooxygenase (ABM) superfamily enzyme